MVISVVLREPTLSISELTVEPVSMESEIVRVVSLRTTGISKIKQLKIQSPGYKYFNIIHPSFIKSVTIPQMLIDIS